MSKTDETDNALIRSGDGTGAAAVQQAERDLTWEFDGVEYPLFMCNRTGNIGIPIMHPADPKRKIAILGADFAWTSDEPFTDHLNLKMREELNVRTRESETKRSNLVKQNAGLFDATVQSGYLIKIDEFGVQSEPIKKTRAEMLAYAQEIQSDLIDAWLGRFSIERYIAPGSDDVDVLLSEPESVQYVCKIGEYKTPAHVLLFTFTTPPADARRSFETDTQAKGQEQDGSVLTTTYLFRNAAKIKFSKKYFASVEGAVTGKEEELEPDTETIRRIGNDKASIEAFKRNFNPHWFVRVANDLADCFNFGGK